MKWYQPIECDNTVKKPFVCDFSNLEENGYDEFCFKNGVSLSSWNEKLYLQARKKKNNGSPDDALQNYMMLPIYSERLINELNKLTMMGIQYLPIKILKSNDEYLKGFCIANILNFIEAFDEEKSIFNRFGEDFPNPNVRGQIAGVMKFVLKRKNLIGFDIIRLKEYELRFFVSENFKNLFEQNKFTGYSFKEIELV